MEINNIIKKCRNLRRKQTDAEKKLWAVLRNRQLAGVKFRRQFPIDKYIVDFYAPECKLAIEADGGQHYEDKNREKDELRTNQLGGLGIHVLRFNDIEILNNSEGVYETIQKEIERRKVISPHLNPLPSGERINKSLR